MANEVTTLSTTAPEEATVDGESEATPVSLGKRFLDIRTLISFGVAFAILYFVFAKMDVDFGDIAARISTANPFYYLVAMAIYYSTFLVRSLRWRVLLENAGLDRGSGYRLPSVLGLAEIVFLSWFANCIMPAKLGDAYRAFLLKRSSQVSFSRTFGTILAERIVDLLLTFVLLALTGLIAFRGTLPPSIMVGMQASLVLVVGVIVGLVAMRHLGGTIRRFLPDRLEVQYGRFEQGTLHSFRRLPLVLGFSVLAWVIEASRLYFVLMSLGLGDISLPVVLFTAIAGSLLTSLPGTPAGLGFVESVIIGILLLANSLGLVSGIDTGVATSVAILDRTISYWSLVIFGLIAYLLTKRK